MLAFPEALGGFNVSNYSEVKGKKFITNTDPSDLILNKKRVQTKLNKYSVSLEFNPLEYQEFTVWYEQACSYGSENFSALIINDTIGKTGIVKIISDVSFEIGNNNNRNISFNIQVLYFL